MCQGLLGLVVVVVELGFEGGSEISVNFAELANGPLLEIDKNGILLTQYIQISKSIFIHEPEGIPGPRKDGKQCCPRACPSHQRSGRCSNSP